MNCKQIRHGILKPSVAVGLMLGAAALFHSCEDDLLTGQPSWLGESIYDELSKDNFKFILVGGITCENVLSKIKEAHPWGVDVSSGVEEADSSGFRYKSFHKMKDLICKVREIY